MFKLYRSAAHVLLTSIHDIFQNKLNIIIELLELQTTFSAPVTKETFLNIIQCHLLQYWHSLHQILYFISVVYRSSGSRKLVHLLSRMPRESYSYLFNLSILNLSFQPTYPTCCLSFPGLHIPSWTMLWHLILKTLLTLLESCGNIHNSPRKSSGANRNPTGDHLHWNSIIP